jgi:hypothetical protein
MGKVTESGYIFQPGYGKGLFGQPYKSEEPMHPANFPAWAVSPERRLAVIVTYLERRAHRHKRPQPGSLEERFKRASALLAAQHQKAFAANVDAMLSSEWDRKSKERGITLTCIQDWPDKVVKMVDLHWPTDERVIASWDAGQCAYKLEIAQRSALVRHLFINLEKIGQELFPDSEQKAEDAGF